MNQAYRGLVVLCQNPWATLGSSREPILLGWKEEVKRLRALASLPCLVLRTHNPLQTQLWGTWPLGPESTHTQRHINQQKANMFKSGVPCGFTEKLFRKCPVAVKGGAAFVNREMPSRPFSLLRCKALACFCATNLLSKHFLRGNPHFFFLPSWARL